METVFKEEDKVYCVVNGHGIVRKIKCKPSYPVCVEFENDVTEKYTYDGRLYYNSTPTLSFTEYTLQGFSQERPTKEPQIGTLCLFSDNKSNFENNIGIVGILKSLKNLDDYRYEHGSGGFFKFCKQIEIKDI